MNVLAPWIRQQFFDNNGQPLAGGKIYFYVSGSTSQYKGTYSDYLGASNNTNPVVLDSTGTAKIFGSGLYDVKITDANDVLIERVEGVNFGGSGGGGEGTSIIVTNYAALRTMGTDYDLVFIEGRETVGDGGEGWFQYINGSTLPDDDGITLVRGSTSKYQRVLGDYIDPRWYGVVYGLGTDQRLSLQASLVASSTYKLSVFVTGPVYLGSNLSITSGQRINIVGSLVGLSPNTEVRFKAGSVIELGKNSINNYIKPIFEQSVLNEINLSWFIDTDDNTRFNKVAGSTTYNYTLNIDLDTTINADISIPSNFQVDVLGGSVITVNAKSKISIPNLVYNGNTQIVKYNNISYIDTIDFGTTFCNLEWFGGVSGYGFSVDNTIAFKAATLVGNIELVAQYYKVLSIASYNTSKTLNIKGKDAYADYTLNSDAIVNCTDLTITNATITGNGSITATGFGEINNSSIQGLSKKADLSQNAKAGVYIPNVYVVAANGGSLLFSSDLNSYTTIPAGSTNLTSIAKGAMWFALVEGTGTAYRSVNGGSTFNIVTISSRVITKLKVLNNIYFALTSDGYVISSTDGISWNEHATNFSSPLRDIANFNGTYIVVGDSARIQTSPDLVTWVTRPIDGSITGNLLAITNNTEYVIVSGALSGVYLRSLNGTTYSKQLLNSSCTIYQTATANNTTVMAGSTGAWISNDKGLTFVLNTFASTVKAVNYNSGSWLFGCPTGYVYQSTDLKTFTQHYIGVAFDVNDVSVLPPVYAVVGDSNSVSISSDNINFTSVTVDASTANWLNVKTINGVTYLMGAAGRLFTTIDFTSFKQVSTGATSDIYDIVYNNVNQKVTIIGNAGFISTTANISNVSPTWVTLTPPTTDTLFKVIWDGTNYTLIDSNNIWRSTDLSSVAPTKVTYSGLVTKFVTVGTAKVMLGPSGYVAVDTGTGFNKITSFTTANVSASYSTGSLAVVGYEDGSIWTSTNGTAWSHATGTGSTKINRIMYDTVHSKWIYVGNSAAVYISSNATSWTSHLVSLVNYAGSTITYTGDLYGCWLDTDYLNISGTNGFWASEITIGAGNFKTLQGYDLGTNSTVKIVAGADSVHANPTGANWPNTTIHRSFAVGGGNGGVFVAANGLNTTYTPIPSSYEVVGILSSIVDYVDGVALDAVGNIWVLDVMHATPAQTFNGDFVADASVKSLCHGGDGYLYAVGDNIWRASASTNYSYFERVYEIPTGMLDLRLIGGTLYVSGSNGLYATSPNGYAWSYAGDNIYVGDIKNIDYYQYTNKYLNDTTYLYPSIFLNGYNGLLLVNNKTLYSGSSEYSPIITANKFDLVNVTANVGLVSSVAGNIQNSNILTITHAGAVSDSVFTKFSGILSGNVVRSNILAGAMITVDKDIVISESTITKTDASDATRAPLFNFTGSILTISFCNIASNSSLMYSEDTGKKVYINYGSCDVKGMSNGYSNVYFAGTGSNQDSTLYSINGITNDTVKLDPTYDTSVVTASTVSWVGLPVGTTSDGTSLVLGANAYLGKSTKTSNVFVFNPYSGLAEQLATINLIKKYGGRAKMEVVYPTGITPDSNVNLRVAIVNPMFVDIYMTKLFGQWVDGQSSDLQIAPKAGAKLINYANTWGGVEDPFTLLPTTDYRICDEYYSTAQMHPGAKEVDNNIAIVIYNAGSGIIPTGTKIKITLIAEMAKNSEIYHAWYPEFNWTLACKDGSGIDQPQHKYSYVTSSKDELRVIVTRTPTEGILIITDA